MVDEIEEYLDETMVHKMYILQSCRVLSKYLMDEGQFDLAIQLIKRCCHHDDSKFEVEEIFSLITINDKSDFKDPNVNLTESKKGAIRIHWANNTHHPEHFSNIRDMSDLDLLEMACDCHSRSIQYDTDFLEFIRIKQQTRFGFPEDVYNKYYNYCQILDSNFKKMDIPFKSKIKKY